MAHTTQFSRWIGPAYAILLLILLFAPFDFSVPFRREQNGARWLDQAHGIEFASNAIIRSSAPATKLHRHLVGAPGLTLEAWIATSDLHQGGPARIATYSLDKLLRNFTLGQEGSALVFRLRTTQTNLNGRPQTVVDGVFSSANPMHLAVTYDHKTTKVYVNGQIVGRFAAPAGGFENWNDGYELALGNELTGNRPWNGKLFRLAIYRRALSESEIRANAAVDPLTHGENRSMTHESLVVLYTIDEGRGQFLNDVSETSSQLDLMIPDSVLVAHKPFLHPPYRYLDPTLISHMQIVEIVLNVVLFVPVGLLLYDGLRRRIDRVPTLAVLVLLIACFLTLSAEILQYFLETRKSSLGDVIHNLVGTAIGMTFAHVSRRRVPVDTLQARSGPDPGPHRQIRR